MINKLTLRGDGGQINWMQIFRKITSLIFRKSQKVLNRYVHSLGSTDLKTAIIGLLTGVDHIQINLQIIDWTKNKATE